jgi:hypothetical protein
MRMQRLGLAAFLSLAVFLSFNPAYFLSQKGGQGEIPFVGCDADGQVGWVNAPKSHPVVFGAPAAIAGKLAYYRGPHFSFGVLAPRGWHCFETYGSGGETLYVAPVSFQADLRYSKSWKGFSGPAIELSIQDGRTSGRFGVASVISRFFPDFREFTRQVIAEKILPASKIEASPIPGESLMYRSNKMVEFRTPPNMDGTGTGGRLLKNDSPVDGVVALSGDEPSAVKVSIRLAPGQRDLTRYIVRRFETDAVR